MQPSIIHIKHLPQFPHDALMSLSMMTLVVAICEDYLQDQNLYDGITIFPWMSLSTSHFKEKFGVGRLPPWPPVPPRAPPPHYSCRVGVGHAIDRCIIIYLQLLISMTY